MHFPLWIFFRMYHDVCGITAFLGCPSSNANATAGLDDDPAFLPLPACCGSNGQTFIGWMGGRTPPWYFNFEKINLPNRLYYQNKGFWHVHTYCFSAVCPESADAKQVLCTSGWWKDYFLPYFYQRKRLYYAAQRLKLETQSVIQDEDTISGFRESERWKSYLNPAVCLKFLALEVFPVWFNLSPLQECWKVAFIGF